MITAGTGELRAVADASGAGVGLKSCRSAPWRWRVALALMLASGFSGLGYQIIWTQQSALWLGHESAAVLAVVTAFFGGLGIGAWLLGPRIERADHPVRWYAGCETVIAGWSLVLAFAMSPCSSVLLRVTGPTPNPLWQWAVAFCGTFLLLLPATAAMGATLPAMERLTVQGPRGRSIAPLYASNTLGAVIGVLAIAFWLIPALGLIRTTVVCAALNVLCAGVSLRVLSLKAQRTPPSSRGSIAALALTGFLGIGYEVAIVRVLSQVAEDTVYTFALLLAVYLLGSSIGAAAFDRWFAKGNTHKRGDWLVTAMSVACLVGAGTLWAAEAIKGAVLESMGPTMTSALIAEAVLAIAAFAVPTIAMGALFAHLVSREGVSFGRALGANTFGAAAAPVIFGVGLLPAIGSKVTLLLIAGGYLVLLVRRASVGPAAVGGASVPKGEVPVPMAVAPAPMPAPVPMAAPVHARPTPAAVALTALAVALALALWSPPLVFIDIPEGGHILSYKEGVMAAVSVVEDADGVSRLRINNRQQEGSSATLRVDARQAWLPLLLHPAPRRALFLGLGTGVTANSATDDRALTVDAVELLPEVIDASAFFIDASRELVDASPQAIVCPNTLRLNR